MKVLRTFFSILLLFIFVAVMAFTLLFYLVDPNKLKPIIAKEVKKKTGYTLTFQGKLVWSMYPKLSIKIDRLTLTEDKQTEPFIQLQGIKFGMMLTDFIYHRNSLPGTLYIEKVQFKGVHAETVFANVLWNADGFILKPITGKLYGGEITGLVTASELTQTPHLSWELQLNQIQLKPLLQDIYGTEGKINIAGITQITFQGQSQGKTTQQILSQMNGRFKFGVTDGVLEGIDFNYFIQLASAILDRRAPEGLQDTHQTMFDQLTGSGMIKEGMARTNDLILVSKAFMTKGEGNIALASKHLDMTLNIIPVQSGKIPWKIPLILTGEVKSPTVRLDMGEIQKLIVKQEIDKVKEKARDQIKKHVPGKTGEFLQHLLGN